MEEPKAIKKFKQDKVLTDHIHDKVTAQGEYCFSLDESIGISSMNDLKAKTTDASFGLSTESLSSGGVLLHEILLQCLSFQIARRRTGQRHRITTRQKTRA